MNAPNISRRTIIIDRPQASSSAHGVDRSLRRQSHSEQQQQTSGLLSTINSCDKLQGDLLRESVSHAIFSHVSDNDVLEQDASNHAAMDSTELTAFSALFDERLATQPTTRQSALYPVRVDELVSSAASAADVSQTSASQSTTKMEMEALGPTSSCPNPREASDTPRHSWSSGLSTASCHSRRSSPSTTEDRVVDGGDPGPAAGTIIVGGSTLSANDADSLSSYLPRQRWAERSPAEDAPLSAETVEAFLSHAMDTLQLEPECLVIGLILLERVPQQCHGSPLPCPHRLVARAYSYFRLTRAQTPTFPHFFALCANPQVVHRPEPKLVLTPHTWRLATLVALLVAAKTW
jgi:hypothetical protein